MNKDLIAPSRLLSAYEKARFQLLEERRPAGYWEGELSTSALSTATAVSALGLVQRRHPTDSGSGRDRDESLTGRMQDQIIRGIQWLADHQNPDGGWGDTELSHSNIATTMMAVAAFHLAGVPARHEDLLTRADRFLDRHGRVSGLRRRYGRDRTFAVPILTNCALAGLVDWREVTPLPFEMACLPQEFYRFLRLPVVSYAIPALVAIGQARFHHRPPLNPLVRFVRKSALLPSLKVLERIQPTSGGFLEAVPLTSFVVMSLASMDRSNHPVTARGVEFLMRSVRADGSWPIDTNLATWNTTLALNALAGSGEEITEFADLDWLLSCQYREKHPYTGAEPGGWGWSDLSGAVPDVDDTAGALLALSNWRQAPSCSPASIEKIDDSARAGLRWLHRLQNADGGWPTFCRGWGKLPFDRSGADLTAHALRALAAWRGSFPEFGEGAALATRRGLRYLAKSQRADGSWTPLWFGNQDHPNEENPIYGTVRVLQCYRDLGFFELPEAQRGLQWLTRNQNPDGGWGGGPLMSDPLGQHANGQHAGAGGSSVEETALVVDILAFGSGSSQHLVEGIRWLVEAVEQERYCRPAPIGFYFAKLWYYERLYPIVFTVSALGQALRQHGEVGRAEPSPDLLSTR